jgi:hypothetical protein
LIAAIATFALKADAWFRRGLLLMLSPDSRANLARCQAEAPLIALCRFPKPALFQIIGLFDNSADAQSYAEDYSLKDWWVAKLTSPGAFAESQAATASKAHL